jgi:hypothetical protein
MSDDGDRVLSDRRISECSAQEVIDVPFECVDVAGWLFSLTNDEFKCCCAPDHISCGRAPTRGGQPLTVIVEAIGGSLLLEPFEAQIYRCDRCELVCLADVRLPSGRHTRAQIVWTTSVEALDDDHSTYTSTVSAYATEDLMRALEHIGTPFEALVASHQAASVDHSARETPRYADSVARWSSAAGLRGA